MFAVTVGGRAVSSAFNDLVTEITVTDAAGANADTASIELDDLGGRIHLPSKNDPLSIALGWEGEGVSVVFEGKIEEVLSTGGRGQGRMLSITAKSADTESKIKEHRETHWDDKSLGDVLQDAGQYAGVSVKVHGSLASVKRDYWSMNGQSFIAFGDKLARELGATFKIRNNQATFVPRNEGIGAGGTALSAIRAAWGDNLISWSLTPALGRPQFKQFITRWFDTKKAKWMREKVEAAVAVEPESIDRYSEFDGDTAKDRSGSSKKGGDREKGGGSAMIDGNPSARAEATCIVAGVRPGIDGAYRIDSVTHNYKRPGGYTSALTLKQPDGEAGNDNRATGEAGAASGASNVA
jgi:phage protein D